MDRNKSFSRETAVSERSSPVRNSSFSREMNGTGDLVREVETIDENGTFAREIDVTSRNGSFAREIDMTSRNGSFARELEIGDGSGNSMRLDVASRNRNGSSTREAISMDSQCAMEKEQCGMLDMRESLGRSVSPSSRIMREPSRLSPVKTMYDSFPPRPCPKKDSPCNARNHLASLGCSK
jgi:hypothetical protein